MYLPDRTYVDVKVPSTATVSECIALVLRRAYETGKSSSTSNSNDKSKSSSQQLHCHAPQCYELRMHDGDGEPDEDFPALDRTREIKKFADDGEDEVEYCLCAIPGAAVPPPPPSPTTATTTTKGAGNGGAAAAGAKPQGAAASASASAAAALTSSGAAPSSSSSSSSSAFVSRDDFASERTRAQSLAAAAPGKRTLTIKDIPRKPPNSSRPASTKQVNPGDTVNDHISKFLRNIMVIKTSLLTDIFEFEISKDDKERLGLMSTTLDGDMDLYKLNVSEVQLRQKVFQDDPRFNSPNKARRAKNRDEGARPDLSSFMFDDLTAGRYKEYIVSKTNKTNLVQNKPQKRRMGIDNQKIYNKPLDAGFKKVTRGDVEISKVKSIEFHPTDELTFVIQFGSGAADGSSSDARDKVIWECECASPYECAEIVAKVSYLVNQVCREKAKKEKEMEKERQKTMFKTAIAGEIVMRGRPQGN